MTKDSFSMIKLLTLGKTDKKLIADYRSQLSSLQQRLEDLEITLREKEAEAIRIKDEEMQRESVCLRMLGQSISVSNITK